MYMSTIYQCLLGHKRFFYSKISMCIVCVCLRVTLHLYDIAVVPTTTTTTV